MADIINEIDEELRKDKAQAWWKSYGKFVIAACLIVVAAVGGYTLYEDYRISQQRALADRFSAASSNIADDPVAAAESLNAFADEAGGEGIALIARFQAAGALAEAGDNAGAAAAFDTIASDDSVDPLYRDLAAVKGILHASLGGEDASALLAEIDPLTQDGEPWRFTARMIAASLAMGAGDDDRAADYLKKVADDPGAPSSARGQASEFLQAIGG